MPATRGTPIEGDRGAFDTVDNAAKHALDIKNAALQVHNPLPGAAGGITISDGTNWITTVNPTLTGILTVPNEGLHLLDTGGDHDLIIKPGTDLSADRILTLTTGDAARTVTLGGNLSIGATTSITGGGTIALGGFTMTVPATDTVAMLGQANIFTVGQTVLSNDGIDIGAAGDADADLITVNVTGAPKLWWDEDPGQFVISTSLTVSGSVSSTNFYPLNTCQYYCGFSYLRWLEVNACHGNFDQSNAAGTKPVLYLDQGDVSEGFIDYLGATAASAVGPISSWTTGNSIQGFVRTEINGAAFWMPYYDAPTS